MVRKWRVTIFKALFHEIKDEFFKRIMEVSEEGGFKEFRHEMVMKADYHFQHPSVSFLSELEHGNEVGNRQ